MRPFVLAAGLGSNLGGIHRATVNAAKAHSASASFRGNLGIDLQFGIACERL